MKSNTQVRSRGSVSLDSLVDGNPLGYPYSRFYLEKKNQKKIKGKIK